MAKFPYSPDRRRPAGAEKENTRASSWFSDVRLLRQLCGDAVSQARGEKPEEFAKTTMRRANEYGLEMFISEPQLKWLCEIADWEMPKRIDQ